MQGMQFQSLGQEDPLEEEIATHSSILTWRIPWTEMDGIEFMGVQRVATPRPRSGAVAEKSYPKFKVRSSGYALLEKP